MANWIIWIAFRLFFILLLAIPLMKIHSVMLDAHRKQESQVKGMENENMNKQKGNTYIYCKAHTRLTYFVWVKKKYIHNLICSTATQQVFLATVWPASVSTLISFRMRYFHMLSISVYSWYISSATSAVFPMNFHFVRMCVRFLWLIKMNVKTLNIFDRVDGKK